MFVCEFCEKSFKLKTSLLSHKKSCPKRKTDHSATALSDENQPSASSQSLLRTKRKSAPGARPVVKNKIAKLAATHKHCSHCEEDIDATKWSQHQRSESHKTQAEQVLTENVTFIRGAFQNRVKTYRINVTEETHNVDRLFERNAPTIVDLLSSEIQEQKAIKFNMELLCEFVKVTADQVLMTKDLKTMQTKMDRLLIADDPNTKVAAMIADIKVKLEEFQEKDSGWSLLAFTTIEVNINKYQPFRSSTPIKNASIDVQNNNTKVTYFHLPQLINSKKACINVQNNDVYAFKWAIISALDDGVATNKQRTSAYKVKDIAAEKIEVAGKTLDFSNLHFPLATRDVKIFEANNPGISVNVYGYELSRKQLQCDIVGPYHLTSQKRPKHINLLYCESKDGSRTHYVYITDMSRLLRSQVTNHKERMHICDECLQGFATEAKLKDHQVDCSTVKRTMRKKGDNIVVFSHFARSFQVPFTVYADFESIHIPLSRPSAAEVDSEKPSTSNLQQHVPCAFSYFIKCSFDSCLDRHRTFVGDNAPDEFVSNLIDDLSDIYRKIIQKPKLMARMTNLENHWHRNATECSICEKKFEKSDKKVPDHCHFTGAYRGPAHDKCNLNLSKPTFFPILLHNFSHYDCHHIVRSLGKAKGTIKIIPLNKETYTSLSKHVQLDKDHSFEMRFLDSFRFLPTSLDTLAKNLSLDNLKTTRRTYEDDQAFKLMSRKCDFPNGYLDSWDRLKERSLPPIEKFHNKLSDEECRPEDYEHAQNVWRHFKCDTFKDYLHLYVKTDVLLLADVFENFRKICFEMYALDPCHYFTTPGLAWDAMLKITKINLELPTDLKTYTLFQKGFRGGLCQCSHRHAVANNKYLKNWDPTKPSTYLMYFDANNLYGWAMSQPLPEGNFKWEQPLKYTTDYILKLQNDDTGYVFEVDLAYPEDLHDLHNDLPFCPENIPTPGSRLQKLTANLHPKTNYVIHLKTLQQCLQNGLILKKVHRVIKFTQSRWLEKYISLNTEHRMKASNKFERDFFELMNNSIYGETMEDVEERRHVRIVTKWDSTGREHCARKLIADPNFNSISELAPDMCAIELKKTPVLLDKPIYLGFSLLELSKWQMYDFHYGYMKEKFRDSARLLYMDTDSFMYAITTDDFYADIIEDLTARFDTSEYPKDNPHNFPQVNPLKLGVFKDENKCSKMLEFVGLRAKAYSFKLDTGEEQKKSKRVRKTVTSKLRVADYHDCLMRGENIHRPMYVLRTEHHDIYTQRISKQALSYADTKRYIREDGISTYAWGHRDIPTEVADFDSGT